MNTPKRTGYVETWTDAQGQRHRRARIRLGDGSRMRIPLPDGYSTKRAQEAAASLQEQEDLHGRLLAAKRAKARRGAALPIVDVKEGDAWFDAWIKAREARGISSTVDNEMHWRHHIRPALAGKHVRDWTPDDMRRLVVSLDDKIATGELAPKSASNIYGTATKMAKDAAHSKHPALRVRDDNPAKDVEGPDSGEDREKQFLYPSEFVQLMSCEDVALRWRRAIALAVYLFPRAGELRALQWADVDLEHGMIHIHQAFERRSRTVKSTKTKKGRRFAIEPAILPLLAAMHSEAGGKGSVCPIPNRMADRLRGWLERAGVKRRELLDEKSRTTKPLGFHDLRATGLTWMAVRGDEPLKIMQRAGHSEFATTMIYVRTAEMVRAGFGDVFPALPGELLGPQACGTVIGRPTDSAHRPEIPNDIRAGHGIRTRDIQLGKLALYQLS